MLTNFKNRLGESFVKGYIRIIGLLDHCPHHDLPPPWFVLHTSYEGLSDAHRREVDLSSGAAFMVFTITQAWKLPHKIYNKR